MEDNRPMARLLRDTSELLSAIEREWQLLVRAAEALSDEQMRTPDAGGWTPPDNLSHVAEWMKVLLGYYLGGRPAHKVIGVSEEITRDWDMEVINPILLERNRRRTRREAMTDLRRTYRRVVARLTAMPFEDLLAPRKGADRARRPVLGAVLGNTVDHFREHRLTIKRAVGRSSNHRVVG